MGMYFDHKLKEMRFQPSFEYKRPEKIWQSAKSIASKRRKYKLFLAALHFNENCNRKQAVTKDGRPQFSVSYPKARKGEPVAKEVKAEQTFGYVKDLMNKVLGLREFRPSYSAANNLLRTMDKNRPLPLSQSTPKKTV